MIIFTGAGASLPLNYPTTYQFFDSLKLDATKYEILEHAKHFFNKQTIDVEELLRLLEPIEAFFLSEHGKFIKHVMNQSWQVEISNFIIYIQKLCFKYYGIYPELEKVKSLYSPLFSTLNWKKQPIYFFTTNYDPTTDRIVELADEQNIECTDGFDNRSRWSKDSYQGNDLLKIYKLHGSMSWIKQGNGVTNSRDYSERNSNKNNHVLIYPGFKGNPELHGEEIIKFNHESLRYALLVSKILIVIGFSFRDNHINNIITETFKENNDIRMIIINPELPKGSEVGLGDVLVKFNQRILHIPLKFGDPLVITELKKYLNIRIIG